MSQFPAQAAIASGGQPQRVVGPVNSPVGMGIPSVQPIGVGGGGGIPGVASMPVPVPNMSAANDLQQALRATQALGSTLIQTGNALNIERQIDERRDTYQAQLKVLQDEPKMLQNFDAGKLNAAIDGSDMDTFVAGQTAGFVGQTEAGTRAYRDAMAQTASKLWVKRNADRQKQEFKDDVLGLHAAMVNPIEGPQPDANTLYDEFSSRYNWLDRSTFMSAVYGSSLKAVAENGDKMLFDQIASGITDDSERTIYVEPLRRDLQKTILSNMAEAQRAQGLALGKLKDSTAPMPERLSNYFDTVNSLISDPEQRNSAIMDGFTAEMQRASSVEDLQAIDMKAYMDMSPDQYREFESRKQAVRQPIIERALKSAAVDPYSDYQKIRQDAQGFVDQVTIGELDRTRVKTIQDRRQQMWVTEYMKDPSKRDELTKAAREALDRYDPAKPMAVQVDSAMDADEYMKFLETLGKADKDIEDANMVGDVIGGSRVLKPSDANWKTVLQRAGAVRNGMILSPSAASEIVLRTQRVPAVLLDAAYAGLAGDVSSKKMALQFLAGIAPAISDPDMAPQIIGFKLDPSDPEANQTIIKAVQTVMPMLATVQRGPDNMVDEKQMDAVLQAFDASVKDWSMTTGKAYDKVRFEEQLRATKMYDPSTGAIKFDGFAAKPDMSGNIAQPFKDLIANKFFREYVNRGMSKESSIQLADWSTAQVMNNIVPLYGNAGLSEDSIKQQISDQMDAYKDTFHVPTISGKGFSTIVPKAMSPQSSWNETMFVEELAKQNVMPKHVTDVFPAIGEGNTWWALASVKAKDGSETKRFIQIDMDRAIADRQATESAKPPQSVGDILDNAKREMEKLDPQQRLEYAKKVGDEVAKMREQMREESDAEFYKSMLH